MFWGPKRKDENPVILIKWGPFEQPPFLFLYYGGGG